MGVNGEALQLHTVYKKLYFLLQVTRESVSVLQVTQESVLGTASHARIHIGTTSRVHCIWTCNEIEGSCDKIIITIVPNYTGKNITRLLPLALLLRLRTRNNTDGNKLMIFSGNTLYYGDSYILPKFLPTYHWILKCLSLGKPAALNCLWASWGVVTLFEIEEENVFSLLHTLTQIKLLQEVDMGGSCWV